MDLKEYYLTEQHKSELFLEVVKECKNLLHNSEIARLAKEYINSRASEYIQNKFDFGFFPPDRYLDILVKKIGLEKLQELNLVYKWDVQEHGQFISTYKSPLNHHNLIIPFKNEYGNIVSLVGRSILSSEEQKNNSISKYKYTSFNKSLHLFGLHQAKKSILKNKTAILVEGQMDCISLHANGFYNSVASGGSALTKFQFNLLLKSCENLHLLLDNDAAGKLAAEKIINRFSKYIKIKKIELPERYKDIDEYLHQNSDFSILSC